MEVAFIEHNSIVVGSMINHADPNCSLYVIRGKVIQDWGDEVLVAWDYSKPEPNNIQRYFKSELRLSKR